MEDESEDSARKSNRFGHNRSFIQSESFFKNTGRRSENGIIPKIDLSDDAPSPKRSRNLNTTDEVEYETQNLALKPTTSSDSLNSIGSRHYSRHSPLGSFRSLRHATKKETDKNGINMVMVMGFGIAFAFGWIFNAIEVVLKWLQLKLIEIQLQLFGGKTITEYYSQEQSTRKKLLYSPVSGLYFILHSAVYVSLKSIEILKKPAPKTLVSNVLARYATDSISLKPCGDVDG